MDFTKLILCLIILGGVALVCFADRKSVKNFDERQLFYRGRAVTIAFALSRSIPAITAKRMLSQL